MYCFHAAKLLSTILKRGRTHVQTELGNKVARRATIRPRATIKEPWHALIEAGLQLEAKLRQAQESSFDRAHYLDFKDAFVALSGIWNTYSSTANALFGEESTKSAKALCYYTALDKKDEKLSELMDNLLKGQTLSDMFDETYRLQHVFPTHRRILDVARIVIRNIIRPLHGATNPSSEGDCVAVWSSIFQEGLPLDSRLSILLGEQGCTASTLSKSKLAEVFDTGTQPRKCDGILRVGPIEVGNFEVKRAGASRQESACQLRKNIKINKSILLELEKYGLECPLLLCIHGMSAVVFRIRKWQDIWVAGKASSTIVLPSNLHELRMFLHDPIHQVDKLLAHYHDYAEEAHKAHQQYQYRQKGEDADDAVASDPKGVTKTLEWEQVVIHSPTKPVKQAVVHSPIKSGKQQPSLLERMKRARKSEQRESEVSDEE
ncbi:hypothetical protein BG015_003097 [Linnemannia schmuckeri]|uniref:Uncharacterized protein n=1 Tax=Linnemannia schmuckeri TaxID=64567 RepID=A0A9P5RNC0_9FUNG|nr:hypothetical protein BG015_003097 [Linnemannia schmuckeri]